MSGKKLFFGFIYFVFGAVIFFSCQSNKKSVQNEVSIIKGTLTNTLGVSKVILNELNVSDIQKIDSAVLDDKGHFSFELKLKTPGFYLIELSKNNVVTLLVSPGEDINLVADAQKMKYEYKIQGSEGSEILHQFFMHSNRNMKSVDSLREIFIKGRDRGDFAKLRNQADSIYQSILNDQKSYARGVILKNPGSLASIFILNQHFGPHALITEQSDFDIFSRTDSMVMKNFPDNKHALDHHGRVTEYRRRMAEKELAESRLQPGKPAPDFRLENQKGKLVSLSDFKGNIVLLNFWSAMKGKCRQDHGAMNQLYKTFKNRNFKILAVSMDANPEMWKAAIQIDRMDYDNLIEPAGKNSSLFKIYNLDEDYPAYFLIDRQGMILDKGKDLISVTAKLKNSL